jgi:hypothetical protein
MATRNHVTDRVEGYSPESLHVIRWAGLLTTDVGDWVTVPQHTDYSVQVVVDSGTTLVTPGVRIDGSNAVGTPVAKNIGVLNDSRGYTNTMEWVFADGGKMRQGLEAPVQMRPNFYGTGDSSVTVIISFKKVIF